VLGCVGLGFACHHLPWWFSDTVLIVMGIVYPYNIIIIINN